LTLPQTPHQGLPEILYFRGSNAPEVSDF